MREIRDAAAQIELGPAARRLCAEKEMAENKMRSYEKERFKKEVLKMDHAGAAHQQESPEPEDKEVPQGGEAPATAGKKTRFALMELDEWSIGIIVAIVILFFIWLISTLG